MTRTTTIISHDGGACPVPDWVPVIPSYRGPADAAKGTRIRIARREDLA